MKKAAAVVHLFGVQDSCLCSVRMRHHMANYYLNCRGSSESVRFNNKVVSWKQFHHYHCPRVRVEAGWQSEMADTKAAMYQPATT